MWRFVANFYARRVVNVNVNILAAGVLALGPVLLIVRGYHLLGLDARWLPALTFGADVLCDIVFYYGLHFLANHLGKPRLPFVPRKDPKPPGQPETAAAQTMHVLADASVEHVPFFKDATKVQLQRAILSPLLYALWLGTQWFLVHVENWNPVPATALGFAIGVLAARFLHTIWMLWDDRRHRLRRLSAGANLKSPDPATSGARPAPLTLEPRLEPAHGSRPSDNGTLASRTPASGART
ncbi:MAG: hypothetical protein AB7K52_02855 [Phycisphaerales bacterium]